MNKINIQKLYLLPKHDTILDGYFHSIELWCMLGGLNEMTLPLQEELEKMQSSALIDCITDMFYSHQVWCHGELVPALALTLVVPEAMAVLVTGDQESNFKRHSPECFLNRHPRREPQPQPATWHKR